MSIEICEFCDGGVEVKIRRVPFHYRKEMIYVDNVPVKVCRKCGELYFEASVYKQLEKIAVGRKKIKASVTFPLADFRAANTLGSQ